MCLLCFIRIYDRRRRGKGFTGEGSSETSMSSKRTQMFRGGLVEASTVDGLSCLAAGEPTASVRSTPRMTYSLAFVPP